MSDDQRKDVFARGEEFLHFFNKGMQFTREILQENERLRRQVAQIRERQETAARNPEDWGKLRVELLQRIHKLEEDFESCRERLVEVEEENHRFAERYLEVEEENNNLANLYVSSYQLHSTLDLEEVLKIIVEIVINLIGAEVFAIYLVDEHSGHLRPVAAEGSEPDEFPVCTPGSGRVGEVLRSAQAGCWDAGSSTDLARPIACIPLSVQEHPIGVIAIHSLLQQKEGFTQLDHELFTVLGGHAATAVFAARLYSQSERKLNTIQGFIDLLAR